MPGHSLHADLADALRSHAVAAGASEPRVRGADWRLAVVDTVGGDGTVTTTDGIVCRQLESYQRPLVGETIVITRSSSGSWLALGRTASASSPGWASFTPAWTGTGGSPSIGNGVLAGRYALHGRTCHVAVVLDAGSTTNGGSGTYLFGVPFPAASGPVDYIGSARFSGASTWIGQALLAGGNSVLNVTFPLSTTDSRAANMTSTRPETFSSGSEMRFSLSYQIA